PRPPRWVVGAASAPGREELAAMQMRLPSPPTEPGSLRLLVPRAATVHSTAPRWHALPARATATPGLPEASLSRARPPAAGLGERPGRGLRGPAGRARPRPRRPEAEGGRA